MNKSLVELSNKNSNLYLWDTFDVLCPGKICKYSDENNNAFYSDSNHLINYTNRIILSPSLNEFIRINLEDN